MFPPKTSDIFSPEGGCSEVLDPFRFFTKTPILTVLGDEKYIYVLQQVSRDFLPCYLIQYIFVFPTTCLTFLFYRLQRQDLFMAFKRVPRR